MKVTFQNNFHNTSATVTVKSDKSELSVAQYKKVARKLCGIDGCQCGDISGKTYSNVGYGTEVAWEYVQSGKRTTIKLVGSVIPDYI